MRTSPDGCDALFSWYFTAYCLECSKCYCGVSSLFKEYSLLRPIFVRWFLLPVVIYLTFLAHYWYRCGCNNNSQKLWAFKPNDRISDSSTSVRKYEWWTSILQLLRRLISISLCLIWVTSLATNLCRVLIYLWVLHSCRFDDYEILCVMRAQNLMYLKAW